MSRVFVVDQDRQPLMPCTPAKARRLLQQGDAAVLRRMPFVIILKRSVVSPGAPALRLKLDPGSKTTGIAVVNDKSGEVVWAGELTHRGQKIKDDLLSRASLRRTRRNRKTRYRPARWAHRTKPKGWLAPSLMHRVYTIQTWVQRLRRWCPIQAISMELVSFDTQALENPEISGVEYQQGELHGYVVREYLLKKWGHKCAYCGTGIGAWEASKRKHVPLEVEHITPKSKGGSNRVSNLTLACRPCNERKGNKPIEEFLKRKPDVLKRIKAQAKAPLKDAAAVNSTRWALFNALKETGLPVECGTGGRTKWNRIRRDIPKGHWQDAACVGASTPDTLQTDHVRPLYIKCMGHGTRQMVITDKYGFPKSHKERIKQRFGFATGDLAYANVPKGKNRGVWTGRVTVRKKPSFMLDAGGRRCDGIHPKYMRLLQRGDGYLYSYDAPVDPRKKKATK